MTDVSPPIGIHPGTYHEDLHKVAVHLNRHPVRSFDAWNRIGAQARAYVEARFDRNPDFEKIAHNLPIDAFGQLTLDELCKVRHSSKYMMDKSVEELFEAKPEFAIIEKISNSIWRWGIRDRLWNEVVDAYNGIRSFDLGLPGFKVLVDHTTYHNKRGWSKHSGTYLDGVFAFLVLHQGKHVMTIGFSIMGGRRILLQQVQTKHRKGNRWLFRMPSNKIEFIIDRLKTAFRRHRIYVIDGKEASLKTIADYSASMRAEQKRLEAIQERISTLSPKTEETAIRSAQSARAEIAMLEGRIDHLSADAPRIASLYADTGRYTRRRTIQVNGLLHHELAG
jgi:hypothetical protein